MKQIYVRGTPISVNAYKRYSPKTRRPYTTKECKAWMRQIGIACCGEQMLRGSVIVYLSLFFKDKRRRDVDNFIKPILDACNGRLWRDDSDIQFLVVQKHYHKSQDGIIIEYGNE